MSSSSRAARRRVALLTSRLIARGVQPATAVAEGAAKAGRDTSEIDLIVPVFAVPGDSPEDRAKLVQRARTQIAFYGSTPNYAFQFDDLGFEGTTARLGELMKAGDLAGMGETITDDMLEHFAVVSSWDDMADRLRDRYAGVARRLVMYLTAEDIKRTPENLARWGEIAQAVRAA